jgi:hypothetical protein
MKRFFQMAAVGLTLVLGLVVLTCTQAAGAKSTPLSLGPAFEGGDLAARFAGYFVPVKADVQPAVPSYTLPLADKDIQNLADVKTKLGGRPEAWTMLGKNGFVTMDFGQNDDVVKAYKALKDKDVPIFITSDSVLHLYHIQFDETLRAIEEKQFYPDLIALTKAFQEEMQKRYAAGSGLEKDAYQKGLAYFSVARKLLEPDAAVPGEVKDQVSWELERIDKHAGFPSFEEAEKKAVFAYPEDYSQYVPRGHYTRSEELKRYFKAMMWYGRLTMLIKGHDKHGPDADQPALVTPKEAQAQTILAAAVAGLMSDLKVGDRTAAKVWERIYIVTAYYVGLADDLCPQQYRDALAKVFGASFDPAALADAASFNKLKAELVKLNPPAIYSGTGASAVNIDKEGGMSPEQLDRILGKTMGLRFMGQRYVPDSYILGKLVAPSVGPLTGAEAFTTVRIPDYGQVRGFPRGLDVFAVLGSERSLKVLADIGDSKYQGFDKAMADLRAEFGKLTVKDWNRNLYWSWLYALKGLAEPTTGKGWPTFMTTDAWTDKELNAALGSWSSLRHDTILYAKQSYTPTIKATSAEPPPPPPRPVVGYVEPVPEFYARLVALTKMSEKGLSDLKVLAPEDLARLQSLGQIIARLQGMAEKELKNQPLTPDDYDFIRDFGERLSAVVTGAKAEAQKTTLVADVHTDQNTSSVLEEATGYLRVIAVAYKMPQGHVLVGAGPVFSYYEFKHPMSDRLTDEKWRELLSSGKAPGLPEWTKSFADGIK